MNLVLLYDLNIILYEKNTRILTIVIVCSKNHFLSNQPMLIGVFNNSQC